ncbi:hypothetical protein FCM35_KLT06878 [Carex littledalei]|uniref:Uncharacterized protein n=1 Tax=Carex littledalei TaxID=544730 RepID=A0A833V839_9POAL|nr:hypothetical protein FCM35_KLT06878 [Carex littledalei]
MDASYKKSYKISNASSLFLLLLHSSNITSCSNKTTVDSNNLTIDPSSRLAHQKPKYPTTGAMSVVSPIRPELLSVTFFTKSSFLPPKNKSVFTGPGATTFAVTPVPCNSLAT